MMLKLLKENSNIYADLSIDFEFESSKKVAFCKELTEKQLIKCQNLFK